VSGAELIARAHTAFGDVVLRRRDEGAGPVDELVVNGVFAMDSAEVTSELALADAAAAAPGIPPGRVLVGGLGLGYTAARLLASDAELVRVVELAQPLVDWAMARLTPQLGSIADDPRTELVVADVVTAIESEDGRWDAILLDVDNGPSFLIHDENARVYSVDFLRTCLTRLVPGGRLVIWCEQASPELAITLNRLARNVEEILVPVTREGRSFEYALYRVVRD
jgi:Spermidine synthase